MKIFKIAFTFFLMPVVILGWSASTHKLLSEYACKNSKLVKDFLIFKFNLDMGSVHPLTIENETKTVAGWIYYGEEKEDAGNLPQERSARHFHNPLKILSEAGLIRWIPFLQQFQSSIVWAQDGVEQEMRAEGDMSWQKIRFYYYNALIFPDEEIRHALFGRMFKGLGHQMHLIQDMSNPEHTRNDNHPFISIESWAEEHNNDIIKGFCQTPRFPNVDLKTFIEDSSTGKKLFPIARLTDADVYVSGNPIPSDTMQQGLAEYSNANFFSDDTIFSIDFPYPSLINADISKIFTKINTEYKPDEKGVYLPKTNNGDPITHFLRLPYLTKYSTQALLHLSYLDYLCYKDYTSMLIPRAVGYSAALINYFFRGEIEVSLPICEPTAPPPQLDGIYAFCIDPANGFKKISLMVKNITPDNEEMINGRVSLVISYRMCTGNPFVPDPPILGVQRFYKLYYCSGVTSIPRDNPLRLDVDLSGDPLPVTAMDVTLAVVFKGDLGAEKADAVAIGFKDISEPTPIDVFNNTKKICFNNNYVNYDDPALWAVVDVNPKNGRIDCLNGAEVDISWKHIYPLYLRFNGLSPNTNNYYYKFEDGVDILPGEPPLRFYVLADAFPANLDIAILEKAQSMEFQPCQGYANIGHSKVPYLNKLVWESSPLPRHDYASIHYYDGFPSYIFISIQNKRFPETSNCSESSSGSSSSSSQL
jgi:hypothetical protein